jgi:hypothetical protein
MSEITLFKRWTIKKKYLWWGLGLGIPLLCVLGFFGLFLLSPRMGGMSANDVFYGDGEYALGAPAMDTADEGFYYDEPAMEEAMAEMEAIEMDKATAANSFNDQDTIASNSTAVTERLIIREGNITIAVESTLDVRDQIDGIVAEMAADGAYVVTSSESGRGEGRQPYINMVIRVPVESFDRIMDQIAEMGVRVDERYENAQDVTDEYVDVQGRIDALEISIDRLQELMRDAAFTEDLLNAEEQLARREAELEALKGRLQYLSDSAALSRINIGISPYELSEPIDTSWKPAETFRRAVENLILSMQDFADFMIVFAIAWLPWLLVFGLIIWGVVAIVRRRRSKKAEPAE